jgi:hypothetical protein
MSRRRKVIIGVLLLVVLLPGLWLVLEHVRGRRALGIWLDAARARGERLDMADFVPGSGPGRSAPSGNAMNFAAAAGMLSAQPVVMSAATEFIGPGRLVPLLLSEKWEGLHTGAIGFGGRPRTNLNWTAAAAQVASNAPTLRLLHDAIAQGELNFNIDYRQGFSTPLTHLSGTKQAAQWLAASALVAVHDARMDEAQIALQDALTLTRLRGREPLLISQLVRQAGVMNLIAATWQALQSPRWTEPQLAQLQQAWEAIPLAGDMITGVEMERAMVRWEFTLCRRNPRRLVDLVDSQRKSTGNPANAGGLGEVLREVLHSLAPGLRATVYGPLWEFAWADQDELRFLQESQMLLDRAREADRRHSLASAQLETVLESFKTDVEEGRIHFRYPLSSLVSTPSTANAVGRSFRAEALRELAITAVALERHRLRQGTYPGTLEALVPAFLARVPVDPMNGQPLHYKLLPPPAAAANASGRDSTPPAYLLYSVGADFKDDGGDASPVPSTLAPGLNNGKDLVWPRAAMPPGPDKVNSKSQAPSSN